MSDPKPSFDPTQGKASVPWGMYLVIFVLVLFAYQTFFGGGSKVKAGAKASQLQLEQLQPQKLWAPSWQKKVTVLEFWATWCRVCVAKLAASSQRAARSQKAGVQHLMINVDVPSSRSQLRRALRQLRIPKRLWYVHHRDVRYQGSREYKLNVMPTVVIIDKQGKIAQYYQGVMSDSLLQAYVKHARQASLRPADASGMLRLAHVF